MAYDSDNLPPIDFTAAGSTPEEREKNLALVEPSPGFGPTANFCVDIIVRDADITVLDFTAQQVNIRFRIDGIWHPGPVLDREDGDFMLATVKQLAGMNFRERRQRQEGNFKTLYQKRTQKFNIVSQGVRTGERVAINLDYKRPPLETPEELGMRSKMKSQISAMIANPEMKNLLVIGYPNGNGYTSTWKAVTSCADRLTRDFYVIQPADRGENEEVINIFPWEYDPAKGETPLTTMPDLLLKQPDVLAFPDLETAEIIDQVVELSSSRKIPIFTRHPGKHCLDGLLRLIAKKPDAQKFVEHLDGIVSMRIIRKLCDRCKIAFAPHPQLLQKLGLPQGRVAELYQPFIHRPDMVDEDENPIPPCPECSGIGFRGRTGLFELLTMTDNLRKAVIQKPQLKYLQAVADQGGHVSMKMEGVLMIAKGITSVDELQRVLKG
jgi:type II secretory ATPase GspE/PulE/Tfp pilus assembly ATPase PilB-like protein